MSRPEARSEFDVLVVGGGPAGIGAACAAVESSGSVRVGLIDESPWPGGQIWRGEGLAHGHSAKAGLWLKRLAASGVEVRSGSTVIGTGGAGVLVVEDRSGAGRISYNRLILCSGSRERFLPFPGWTSPRVVGAGGLQTLVKSGWPVEGKRVVVAGSGPLLLAVADGVNAAGGRVAAIVEQASWKRVMGFGMELSRFPAKLGQAVALRSRLATVPYLCGWWPTRVEDSTDGLLRVELTDGRRTREERVDLLACGFGLIPSIELAGMLGCGVKGGRIGVDDCQQTDVAGIYAAGEATGIKGGDSALVEGRLAGYSSVGEEVRADSLKGERDRWRRFGRAMEEAFVLRDELKCLADDSTIVCRCEDVTYGKLKARGSAREAKLQTRCGMGPCQGRVCGGATSFLFGWEADTVRPPLMASRLSSLLHLKGQGESER